MIIDKSKYSGWYESSDYLDDVAYYIWWTEEDRIRADTWFLWYMLIDIQKINGIKYLYYNMLIYLFYFFVRIFWKTHFTFKKTQAK